MKIGVVTVNNELRRMVAAEVHTRGHEAVVCEELVSALKGGTQLIFAEWVGGEQLAATLAGLQAAVNCVPPLPVVVLVPTGAVTAMSRARAAGAVDVLFYPPDPEEIHAEIEEAEHAVGATTFVYPERFRALRQEKLIGEDRAFLRCLEDIRRAAQSDANVLLLGETGTGKEMVAQSLHELSPRSDKEYKAVNCAAFPGALLEAELFGHTKGAFTGADRERVGRFEEAGDGTLLLDEIGDIELSLQTKLLRVVEQREFQRLGENRNRKFAARLVSATSVNLDKAVVDGRFRPDLLGRLNQFRIVLPSLRERCADIPILIRHFVQKHANGRMVELSKTALEMLEAYDFPMNVRQLENAILGALLRSAPSSLILPKHLPSEMASAPKPSIATTEHAISLPSSLNYKEAREHALRAVDQQYLSELLLKHHHNLSRVADEAGIDRKTLRDRLRGIGKLDEDHSE